MYIRTAKIEEFEEIKTIFKCAREFMVSNGNLIQWANLEELFNTVLDDIKNGNFYVCVDENKIACVFSFFIGIEPTYIKIYDGEWLNDKPYGVIHRIAVTEHNKGFASFCIEWCFNKFPNIKIDTHKNNIPMQKTILKNGFTYCGIIKKPDGTERLAYQKYVE